MSLKLRDFPLAWKQIRSEHYTLRKALCDVGAMPLWYWAIIVLIELPFFMIITSLSPPSSIEVAGYEIGQTAFNSFFGLVGGLIMSAIGRILAKSTNSLRRPPASRLVSLLQSTFPRKAFDMIFSQIVLDFRDEHSEMLAKGRRGRARWLAICLWGTLVLTTATWCVTNIAKRFVDIWKVS